MATKTLSYEALVKGGLTAQTKLVVPVLTADPGSPADGWVWVNTTDHVLRYRENGVTVTVGSAAGIDAEAVRDIVGATLIAGNNIDLTVNDAGDTITIDVESLTSGDITDFLTAVRAAISVSDSATLDLSYTTGVLSGAVLDSPTLQGSDKAYYRNTDNHVDGTTNHVFTAADDTKLTGIAPGATANATDSQLRDRSTHTGTQPASTISDFATAVGALTLDADTLNGQTAAQIQTAVTSAIVDGSPGTLDTLNELAAALGDDANYAATVSTALAARSRFYAQALTGGTDSEVVTHNLGTRRVLVQVYVNSGSYEEEDYQVLRTSVNTVTVTSSGNIPSGREIVITTAA